MNKCSGFKHFHRSPNVKQQHYIETNKKHYKISIEMVLLNQDRNYKSKLFKETRKVCNKEIIGYFRLKESLSLLCDSHTDSKYICLYILIHVNKEIICYFRLIKMSFPVSNNVCTFEKWCQDTYP